MVSIRTILWVFAMSLLLTASALAEPAAARSPASPVPPESANRLERELKRQLAKRCPEVRIDDKPFGDVIDFLHDMAGVTISVEWQSLEAARIHRFTPVSVHGRDRTLAEILTAILADAGTALQYTTADGVITISVRVPSFTDEASIMSVLREDQAEALKAQVLKKELTLPQVINVLTSYRKVTRDQYLVYAHRGLGARGSVTLKDGTIYVWEIEPDYAATVTAVPDETVYLLHPRLETESARFAAQP